MALALFAPDTAAILQASKTSTPPAPFIATLKSLPGSGFHVNTRLGAQGYAAATVCDRMSPAPAPPGRVCDGLLGSWRTSIVADKKAGGSYVVQEIWAFAYENSARAAGASGAVDEMTFGKHPYVGFSSGRYLYYVEGRFRFAGARQRLAAYVFGVLSKHAPKLVRL